MIGTKLAHYEITSHIGTGGMGEVYQAADSKLGRRVAIKVVPEAFSHDTDRVSRFAREARVLASLNHPNIAAIYGIEESGGRNFLVMELVPGETLANQLQLGPLLIEDALPIARQIAEGLEAAHEKSIVHRDLKPANIKVTPQGQVKILDFGLAKAFAGEAADINLANSPTMTQAATMAGVILGTAAYMSPEQAKGKDAGSASDIWAFGCVFYEMLTGRAVFPGETLVEILGGVIKSEPDWTALPPATPPQIVSLLKRCLQKDRSRRLRDVADARFQIEEAMSAPATPGQAVSTKSGSSRERLVWSAIALVLAGALAVSALYPRAAGVNAPEMRLDIVTPPAEDFSSFALSPNGQYLVFQATTDGKSQLWLRSLAAETAQPLAGTEGGSDPFWAPTNQSIGFFAEGKLKRIDIAGGLPQTLTDVALTVRSGAWSPDGTIVFTHSNIEPLYRILATGGKAEPATELRAPHAGHRFPHFLPDGRHFIFYAYGTKESQGAYVGSLDSKESKRLMDSDWAVQFVPPDYVLFGRQGAVLAQRMNLDTLQPIGDPLPVASQAAMLSATMANVALSTSMTGLIAYRANPAERQLRWVGRSGEPMGLLGGPDSGQPSDPRISPDGLTVALTRMVNGNNDIWFLETGRDVRRRFTTEPTREYNTVWSPEGDRLFYGSTRNGRIDIYEKPVGSAGMEKLVWESTESKNVSDISLDSQWLLFITQNPKTSRDIWALPLSGEKKPILLVQTPAEDGGARFSPDGHWIAYVSAESGRAEIYLQPFPGPGSMTQVSTVGGTLPQWRRDGKELFYMGSNGRLMAQPIAINGSRVELGTPMALFSSSPGSTYAAMPDGQKFLLNETTKPPSPITILLNWKPR